MNPPSLNRYVYCINNPINLIDPSGHSWLSDAIDSIGGWFQDNVIDPIKEGFQQAMNELAEEILGEDNIYTNMMLNDEFNPGDYTFGDVIEDAGDMHRRLGQFNQVFVPTTISLLLGSVFPYSYAQLANLKAFTDAAMLTQMAVIGSSQATATAVLGGDGKRILASFAGGALTYGIGRASFLNDVGQFGQRVIGGAIGSGAQAAILGENIGDAMLIGAASAGADVIGYSVGEGIAGANYWELGHFLGGALGSGLAGGVVSRMTGGSFSAGLRDGLITGALTGFNDIFNNDEKWDSVKAKKWLEENPQASFERNNFWDNLKEGLNNVREWFIPDPGEDYVATVITVLSFGIGGPIVKASTKAGKVFQFTINNSIWSSVSTSSQELSDYIQKRINEEVIKSKKKQSKKTIKK